MRDCVVTVPGGRTFASTDLGDLAGAVAMYSHRAPTSRLDVVSHKDQFTRSGVHVLSHLIARARLVLLLGQAHVSRIREIPQLCADLTAASKGAAR